MCSLKRCVNRIEFDFLVKSIDSMYGRDWDEAEPDDGGNREVIEMMIKVTNKQ